MAHNDIGPSFAQCHAAWGFFVTRLSPQPWGGLSDWELAKELIWLPEKKARYFLLKLETALSGLLFLGNRSVAKRRSLGVAIYNLAPPLFAGVTWQAVSNACDIGKDCCWLQTAFCGESHRSRGNLNGPDALLRYQVNAGLPRSCPIQSQNPMHAPGALQNKLKYPHTDCGCGPDGLSNGSAYT